MKRLVFFLFLPLTLTLIITGSFVPIKAGGGNELSPPKVMAYLKGVSAPKGVARYRITRVEPGSTVQALPRGTEPVCVNPPPPQPPRPKFRYIFHITGLLDDAEKYRLTEPMLYPKGILVGKNIRLTPEITLNPKGVKSTWIKELGSGSVIIESFSGKTFNPNEGCLVANLK
jgi:hypothetical protein